MTEKEIQKFKDKMQKLAEAGVSASAHNIDGWIEQYNRTIRFFKRTLAAEDDLDRLDFAVTFFQNCYHLRDWIPIIEQIDKNDWNKKWEDFIKNRIEMKICRDICNGTKHLKLNSPSIYGNFSIFLEYEPYHEVLNERQTEWKILVNGQKYSFLDLMNSCLNAWNEFVTEELKNRK